MQTWSGRRSSPQRFRRLERSRSALCALLAALLLWAGCTSPVEEDFAGADSRTGQTAFTPWDGAVRASTNADASSPDASARDARSADSASLDGTSSDSESSPGSRASLDASAPSGVDAASVPWRDAASAISDAAAERDAESATSDAAAERDAESAVPPTTGTVALAWAEPASGATLKGKVTFRFTGRAFQNVELFQAGTMLVRATVSADRTSASATFDTAQLANGALTLTAHAWNSPPNTAFTSEADAGARSFVVDNGGGMPVTKPLLGVFCGNSVDGIRQFEQWLGRPVDGILGYTGNADWTDYDGSVGWAVDLWSGIDRRVFWSVPLIVNGASLAQAGAGAYDDHYRKAAQTLASFRPQEPKLYIRTGWEFNGDWFPWSGQGKAADFKAAFRRFVTVFRSVSDRFMFEWNVNVGDVGMNPETAYPGDDVVDIIGMDFYWQTHLPTDAQQAWNQIVNQQWGLKWHQDFAKAHGKPTAYSEWGVRYDNASYYVQQAKLWFEQHPVLYHNYWNDNFDYPGKLSDGQYARTGSAFKAAFGP